MNTGVIKSIEKDQITQAVYSNVSDLGEKHPEIERVIRFGSWVTGLPSPGSDVDICLILSKSDKLARDRISEYLPLGFPVGIDLFAYTSEEFNKLKNDSPGWYKTIISEKDI